ncbi:MAG: PadR family transcriptional regulator [Oscillospiraceae bacterium]|nr:PadR family transcriptional regulator [Oscillospiraceae bacterium]
MNSQLKRGTLELCVLSILNGSDCYGYELVNKISECMQVTEGTIYPLMKRLKESDTIDSYIVESQEGPPRKYYKITETGKTELERLSTEWFEFVKSVNELLKGDKQE